MKICRVRKLVVLQYMYRQMAFLPLLSRASHFRAKPHRPLPMSLFPRVRKRETLQNSEITIGFCRFYNEKDESSTSLETNDKRKEKPVLVKWSVCVLIESRGRWKKLHQQPQKQNIFLWLLVQFFHRPPFESEKIVRSSRVWPEEKPLKIRCPRTLSGVGSKRRRTGRLWKSRDGRGRTHCRLWR